MKYRIHYRRETSTNSTIFAKDISLFCNDLYMQVYVSKNMLLSLDDYHPPTSPVPMLSKAHCLNLN